MRTSFGNVTSNATYLSNNLGVVSYNSGTQYSNTSMTRSLLGSNCTISIWFKFANVGATGIGPVLGFQNGGQDFEITKPNGSTNIGISDNQYNSAMVVGSAAWDGNWHQVVYNFSTGFGTLWLDGQYITTAPFTGAASSTRLIFGAELYTASSSHYFGGQQGVIQVYNKTLSNAEVRQNFNALRSRYGA